MSGCHLRSSTIVWLEKSYVQYMLALMQLYSCSVFYCFMYPYKMHIFWMYLVYIYCAKFYFRNLFLKSISLIDEICLTVVTHMHTFYDLSEKVSIHIYASRYLYACLFTQFRVAGDKNSILIWINSSFSLRWPACGFFIWSWWFCFSKIWHRMKYLKFWKNKKKS